MRATRRITSGGLLRKQLSILNLLSRKSPFAPILSLPIIFPLNLSTLLMLLPPLNLNIMAPISRVPIHPTRGRLDCIRPSPALLKPFKGPQLLPLPPQALIIRPVSETRDKPRLNLIFHPKEISFLPLIPTTTLRLCPLMAPSIHSTYFRPSQPAKAIVIGLSARDLHNCWTCCYPAQT